MFLDDSNSGWLAGRACNIYLKFAGDEILQRLAPALVAAGCPYARLYLPLGYIIPLNESRLLQIFSIYLSVLVYLLQLNTSALGA